MKRWRYVKFADRNTIENFLDGGWEPFAVTQMTTPEGSIDTVWLRTYEEVEESE